LRLLRVVVQSVRQRPPKLSYSLLCQPALTAATICCISLLTVNRSVCIRFRTRQRVTVTVRQDCIAPKLHASLRLPLRQRLICSLAMTVHKYLFGLSSALHLVVVTEAIISRRGLESANALIETLVALSRRPSRSFVTTESDHLKLFDSSQLWPLGRSLGARNRLFLLTRRGAFELRRIH
jgi:hypothetical protein